MPSQIRQIYCDERSRLELDPGFLPLDNTANLRPDWFEFCVIRDFLLRTTLQEDSWYGFLSPKFRHKTGFTSDDVRKFLEACGPHADVALFSPGWDQIAYFLNPFEQGEFWHPGLTQLSQQLIDSFDIALDLRTYAAHSGNSVYSNFLVARPAFWKQWLRLANALFELVEAAQSPLGKALGATTSYGVRDSPFAMKTFVQERLAPVLLASGPYRVASADLSSHTPVFEALFPNDNRTRRLLKACDAMKIEYALAKGRDRSYLDMFVKLRSSIPLRIAMTSPFIG